MEKFWPCPCCGFLTFSTPPGGYEICPVCDWEDDPVQLLHPAMKGGANHFSLWESQQTIVKEIPLDVKMFDDHIRDTEWRPLTEMETESANPPIDGLSYFNAIPESSLIYYWKKNQ